MIAGPARRRLATSLGIAGGALGVAAGAVQATVGASIPDWTGAKQEPVGLGLLTVALSLLAGWCALRLRRPGVSAPARVGYATGLLVPGLLCFSTVGRLWYVVGPLLIAAGLLAAPGVRETITLAGRHWYRVLLALLGGAELLMAAGAAPVTMAVGAVGGAALVLAAARARSRPVLVALVVLGTVPFTALAWTAIVPVLLLLTAVVVTLPLLRHPRTAPARASEPIRQAVSATARWRANEAPESRVAPLH